MKRMTALALLAYRRGKDYILPAGGTSAAAPLWGALVAMADEYARLHLTDPSRFAAERLLAHAAWWIDHTGIGFSGTGSTSHPGEERHV